MSTNLQCITTLSNELVLFLREFVKKYPAAAAGFLWNLLLTTVILWFRQMNWHCVEGDMSKNNYLGIPCWNWIFYNLFLPWEQNFHLTWLAFHRLYSTSTCHSNIKHSQKGEVSNGNREKMWRSSKIGGPTLLQTVRLGPCLRKIPHKWESNHFGAKN